MKRGSHKGCVELDNEKDLTCAFPGDPEQDVQALFHAGVFKSDFLSQRDRAAPKRLLRSGTDTATGSCRPEGPWQ